jgi:poly-gamma-glutamate capsule biosynthesis protein CapA/YwtB (metallophosphatase superfamily)
MNKSIIIRGALILALLALTACQKEIPTVFIFGGDVILARDGKGLFDNHDPWGDAGKFVANLKTENQNSYFMVNLESPLSVKSVGLQNQMEGYNLCGNTDQVHVLKQGEVDLVSMANNHEHDCGGDGFETRALIGKNSSILTAGVDYSPAYFETSDMRIAVIAADDVGSPIHLESLLEHIRNARATCEFLVVSMHWGNEYQAGENQRQRELAQQIADAGADVLWGHHPHVLQPMAWVNSENDDHRMLVMYSLGNLLTDQSMNADTERTSLVALTMKNGKITQINIRPLMMDPFKQKLIFPPIKDEKIILDRLQVDELVDVKVIIPRGD